MKKKKVIFQFITKVHFDVPDHCSKNGIELLKKVFLLMDKNLKGNIEFKDFAITFSKVLFGEKEEKLQLSFDFFDFDRDKKINKNDYLQIVEIYSNFILDNKLKDIKDQINNIFTSDSISFEEFKEKSSKYSELIGAFGVFEFYFQNLYQKVQAISKDNTRPYKKGQINIKKDTLLLTEWKSVLIELKNGVLTLGNKHIPLTSCKLMEYNGTIITLDVAEYHTLFFDVGNEKEKNEWINCFLIDSLEREYNRYCSFAPIRRNVNCFWYVNGKPFYQRLADALEQSKESIYLVCWMISPQLYLKKDYPFDKKYRFDNILLRKAKEGVHIYMALWNETKVSGSGLNSKYCKEYLNSLHPNFHVMNHPEILPLIWGHHQKFIVIDQDHAFQGGFDVCWGRWDDETHRLSDDCHLMLEWPGKDYFNPLIQGTNEVEKPHEDNLDREKYPRMSWHDVQSEVSGVSARDIARNFIERWNIHRLDLFNAQLNRKKRQEIDKKYPFIYEKEAPPSLRILNNIPNVFQNNILNINNEKMDTCTVQNIRSITRWSGSYTFEYSIYSAYIDSIKKAQHYIFIENQYFISNGAKGVQNKVGEYCLQRIKWAIENDKKFKLFILIPITPDGDYKKSSTIKSIMYWQLYSLIRGGTSLIETFNKNFPKHNWNDYIQVISMRNYGYICDKLTTEQVYTHSKILIVDDVYAIIGSANTVDRSFMGDRDSELCQLIEDEAKIKIKMNEKEFLASRFAHTFRMFIFRELIGLDVDPKTYIDPVCDSTWKMMCDLAKKNTKIYETIFPYIPSNKIKNYSQIRDKIDSFEYKEKEMERVKEIQGLIVEYPLHILENETLIAPITNPSHRNLSGILFQ